MACGPYSDGSGLHAHNCYCPPEVIHIDEIRMTQQALAKAKNVPKSSWDWAGAQTAIRFFENRLRILNGKVQNL